MKLVMAIVHDEDVHKLTEGLSKNNFQATKLASTGGFLKFGNTTVLVGVEEKNVNKVIEIIKEYCKTKKQMTVANQPYTSTPEGYIPYPIEVTTGGATVFVIDVEQFFKI